MMQINMNGMEFPVELKNIKHIYIRVLPPDGKVKITAPRYVSDEALRSFVASKITWIIKQQERLLKQVSTKAETEESCISLWGRNYSVEIDDNGTQSEVTVTPQGIKIVLRKGSTPKQRENLLNEWYRKQLKEAIPAVLVRCQSRIGVCASEWNVKNMKTRWGTCNVRKKRIWLNLQLAKKPPECLEYVVTHELVHLLEPSHNRVFYRHMDQYFPEWRHVKNRLNQRQGGGVEEARDNCQN
jgi:predicted metal-dependent hydrolase